MGKGYDKSSSEKKNNPKEKTDFNLTITQIQQPFPICWVKGKKPRSEGHMEKQVSSLNRYSQREGSHENACSPQSTNSGHKQRGVHSSIPRFGLNQFLQVLHSLGGKL